MLKIISRNISALAEKSFLLFVACATSWAFANPEHACHLQETTTAPKEARQISPLSSNIKLTIQKIEPLKDKKRVLFTLTRNKDGSPVTLDQLKSVHTEKIHLLIIDENLEDYSHVHPQPTEIAGIYEFEWQQKKQASYRIWADLFLLETNTQEFAIADLIKEKNISNSKIEQTVSMQTNVEGYTFKLSFDTPTLKVNKIAIGKITIEDTNHSLVHSLETIMGAFAHLVGFHDDFKTVTHIHPLGKEPSNPHDKGGPELTFHLLPEKPGLIRLFVQVRIKGKELFVPFTLQVAP